MATTLEQLQAERARLLAQQEALDREFGSGRGGKEFLTGPALQDWENRVAQNNRILSQNFKEIQAVTGQNSALGQTADQKLANETTTNNPGTGTTDKTQDPQNLTEQEKAKLEQAKSGELSTRTDQATNPVSGANSPTTTSEAAYTEPAAANQVDTVKGAAVSGNKSDFASTTSNTSTKVAPKNKLHDYTSYTYRITLFFLTAKDYNNLAANPTTFQPTYSLISSAGGYAGTNRNETAVRIDQNPWTILYDTIRHPDFRTDFFIDNLQLTTTTGLNAKTKASNAIDISFNITEPYGLSLLDRLLSVCETSEDRNPNYMAQPYLLQIDILANPTDEKLTQLNQTNNLIDQKRIAIKLLEMKIRPTGSGTVYNIRAMPYNHTAFSMTTASIPIPFNIEASTVGDFFGGAEETANLLTQLKIDENRVESELKKYIDSFNEFTPATPAEIENRRRAIKNAFVFSSKNFTAAYNVYMESIATAQQLSTKPPTKIAFNIPNAEIANSRIVDDLAQNSDATMANQENGVRAGQSDDNLRVRQSFNIHKGSSIIDVIDQVMGKSEYVKNQLNVQGKQVNDNQANSQYSNGNERTDNEEKPKNINWYKIIPTVALTDFDFARNNYSKTVLYSILPYTIINPYHPNFPKGTSQNAADRVVRVYDYLYTGKNQDILKLDIDFDSTYYTQITSFRNQVARQGQNAYNNPSTAGGFAPNEFATNATSGNVIQTTNPPVSTEIVGSNADSNSMNSATNPKDQIVTDFKTSIYTKQRGDALNIKLQILGDPAFIKQDDVFYNPGGNIDQYAKFLEDRLDGYSTAPISKSGQILFDSEQVFVRVNFKNAVDINDSIGIVNKQEILRNGRTTDGSFSGVYKVQLVTSEFSRGQFTQTLDLVRIPDPLPKPTIKTDQIKETQKASNTDSSEFLGTTKPALSNSVEQAQASSNTSALVAASEQPAQNNLAAPENANTAQNIAPQTTAGTTFQDVFTQARKDFGNKPGGSFEYRGKLYQTNYQNEPYVTNPTPVYPGANQ